MTTEFVPYEQALALKELGFDEPCFATFYKKELSQYPNSREEETGFNITPFELVKNTEVVGLIADTITAPLYQQAFRWFREKYKLNSQIAFCEYSIESCNSWKYTFDNPTGQQYWDGEFNTYEEAELACLIKLIEIVKKK
jgi:hypothetical protein